MKDLYIIVALAMVIVNLIVCREAILNAYFKLGLMFGFFAVANVVLAIIASTSGE